MSDFLNAFEAFLGKPSGAVTERRGASASPTPPSRPKSARRRRSAGVLVKANSPEAEILTSTPSRKSGRKRRKKLSEDISSSNSDSDYSAPVRIFIHQFYFLKGCVYCIFCKFLSKKYLGR